MRALGADLRRDQDAREEGRNLAEPIGEQRRRVRIGRDRAVAFS